MKFTKEQIDELIYDLQGTCKSIEDGLYSVTDGEIDGADELSNEKEVLEALDNEIYNCEQCGWWVEAGDINDEGHCSDCAEEEED